MPIEFLVREGTFTADQYFPPQYAWTDIVKAFAKAVYWVTKVHGSLPGEEIFWQVASPGLKYGPSVVRYSGRYGNIGRSSTTAGR